MPGRRAQTKDLLRLSTVLEDDPRAVALVAMLRLNWFTRLRWIFLLAAAGVLALEWLVLTGDQRPIPVAGLLVALGIVNLAWTTLSRLVFRHIYENPATIPAQLHRLEIFVNAQVAVDLLLLTGILRYTGGVENPLTIFYMFHMAIVSLLLKRWQAILQGIWAVLLYAGLVIGEWRQWLTPHFGFLPGDPGSVYNQPVYVFAALGVVACGIFGVLHFTLYIAGRLNKRERELQQTNTALRQSQQAIQDLQRRRSRFMQTAAHQLKSPLAMIQTLTELIRSRVAPGAAVPTTCEKIIRRCREGIVQVGELLTLARVQETDPRRHSDCEADVRQIVFDLCARFKPLAEERDILLVCRLPKSGELTARVDPRDLKDCLANLIDNAIKFTDSPGNVRVTVTPRLPSGTREVLSINVSDNGMGVDPALLVSPDGEPGNQPVFDAFLRGNNAIEAGIPGTGLGLSIVREVVEQAGGRIRVTSRPGRGSSFTITLPAGIVADQPQVRTTQVTEIALEPPTQHNG